MAWSDRLYDVGSYIDALPPRESIGAGWQDPRIQQWAARGLSSGAIGMGIAPEVGESGLASLVRNLKNQAALKEMIPELGERLYSMGTPLTNIPKAIGRAIGGWGKKIQELVPVMEGLQPATVAAEERIPLPLGKLAANWTDNWLGRLGVTVPYVDDPVNYPVALIPRNRAAQRGAYKAIFGKEAPLNMNAYYQALAPNDTWAADVISIARDAQSPMQSVKHETGHLASTRVRGYHKDFTNTPVERMAQDRARFVQPIPGEERFTDALNLSVGRNTNKSIAGLGENADPMLKHWYNTATGYKGPQVGEEIWTRSQALNNAGNPQIGGIPGLLEDPFWKTLADVRKSYTHPSWYQGRPDLPGPPALMSYVDKYLEGQPGKWDDLRKRAQDYIKQYGDFAVKNFNLDQ